MGSKLDRLEQTRPEERVRSKLDRLPGSDNAGGLKKLAGKAKDAGKAEFERRKQLAQEQIDVIKSPEGRANLAETAKLAARAGAGDVRAGAELIRKNPQAINPLAGLKGGVIGKDSARGISPEEERVLEQLRGILFAIEDARSHLLIRDDRDGAIAILNNISTVITRSMNVLEGRTPLSEGPGGQRSKLDDLPQG